MRPGPNHPFVLATRLLTATYLWAAIDLVRLSWWYAPLILYTVFTMGRLPRRRLLLELALVSLATAYVIPATVLLAGLCLLACLLAPESGLLRANGLDRFFLIQQYPGTPVNSHGFIDVTEPLDRALVLRAVEQLMAEIPLFRSFVRESFWSVERFATRRPYVTAESVVHWLDHPVEEHVTEVLDRPMDLEREPPFRIVHAPRPEGGYRVAFTIHHSAADGTGQYVFVDRFSVRYNALRASSQETFPPEPPMLRLRDVLKKHGYLWALRLARRHVRPMDKVGVMNASLLDDETPRPYTLRHQLGEIPAELWDRTVEKAKAVKSTTNDILLAASLRAAVAWRRERQKPERPFRILLPTDLRSLLRMKPGFQNFVGVVRADFSIEEVLRPDLVALISTKVKAGRELDEALETPFNLGLLSDYLPPWLFRRELRRFDEDPRSFFFSYLFSHVRLPRRGIALPEGTKIERLWGRGSLARQPGFGVIVFAWAESVALVFEYIHPQASDEGTSVYRRLFLEELEKLLTAS